MFWTPALPCDCSKARLDQQAEAALDQEARRQAEEIRRKQIYERLLQGSKLPRRYHEARFDTAKRTDNNQDAYQAGIDYCSRFLSGDTSQGLFVTGPVETGKTHLAGCIATNLMRRGSRVTFGSVYSLLGRLKDSYGSDRTETEEQIFDELARTPLLIIDDLGKEKVSAFVERVLFQIIDERYNHMRGIVVTSNWTLTALEGRYTEAGSAIVSRLSEMCEGIRMTGDKWRRP